MPSTMTASRSQNLGLVFTLLCLFGWGSTSPGQSVFDPYQPYSSDYASSSFPTLPNNLALPGQAREARQYQTYTNVRSSAGTFDRFVNGDDSDYGSFGAERRGGIGVPYYDVARQSSRINRRDSPVIREADRALLSFEADKNRRYQAAIKEKDPAQRARLLREIARMQPPQSTFGRGTEPRNTTAKRANSLPQSETEALAAEALAGAKPVGTAAREAESASARSGSRTRPSVGRTLDVRSMTPRQRQELVYPTRRPGLPSRSSLPTEDGEGRDRQNPR